MDKLPNASLSWFDPHKLNYYYLPTDINNDFDPLSQKFDLKPTFLFNEKPYITIPSHHSAYALASLSIDRTLEQVIVSYAQKIKEIKKVYVSETNMLTSVSVVVQMTYYDYDLMNKIFEGFEFPVKDMFASKLIDINYVPEVDLINKPLIRSTLIYNKELTDIKNDLLLTFDVYNPEINTPQVNWYGL